MKNDYTANFRVNKELWDLADHHFPNRSEAIRDFLLISLTNNNEAELRNNISLLEQRLAAYKSQLAQLLEKQQLHESLSNGLEKAFSQCKAIHNAWSEIGNNIIKIRSVEHKVKYVDLLALCEKEGMIIIEFQDLNLDRK